MDPNAEYEGTSGCYHYREFRRSRSSELNKRTTITALCGVIAPPLMAVLWAIASFLRPGYNQLAQKGSELGTGPNSIVMNLNFGITGVLIMIFAVGLIRRIQDGNWSKIGILLLLVCGAGEAITGAFPCDPGCPATTGSFSQNVHLSTAVVFFGSIAITPLILGIGLERDYLWKPYRTYSIFSGLAAIALFAAFSIALLSNFQYVGLLQRLFLAVPFLWIELMAIRSLRLPLL